MEKSEIKALLSRAIAPEDVFGEKPSESFHQMAKLFHPDTGSLDKDEWNLVNHWWAVAKEKIFLGTYGDMLPIKALDYKKVSIDSPVGTVKLSSLLGEGMISRVHGEGQGPVARRFLKVPYKPGDNDLMDREFRNLTIITAPEADAKKAPFFTSMRNTVPFPVAQVSSKEPGSATLRCNLLRVPSGSPITLADLVRLEKFKKGLPKEHAYWILRRSVLTLLMAHKRKIGHGGINPSQILIYPLEHGVALLGWTASYWLGKEKPPIMDHFYEDLYPTDIKTNSFPDTSLDISMLAKTILTTSETLPFQVSRVLDDCTKGRETDCDTLYDRLGTAMEEADGPRKFCPLVLGK